MIKIYCLKDPRDNSIKYIGRSSNIIQRFKNHKNSLHNINTKKRKWLDELKQLNLKPILKILKEVPIKEGNYWEKYYLKLAKEKGYDLTNNNDDNLGNQTSFKKEHIPWNAGTANIQICEICGEEYNVSPSMSNKRRTCSYKCSALLKNKGNEKTQFKKGESAWNKGLKGRKLKPDKNVHQYDPSTGNFIRTWNTAKEASIELNCNAEGIGQCARDKAKSAGGYIWKYYKKDKIEVVNNVKLKIKK